ncbi:DNA-3-methyladenine glycosylase I [Aerococcus agrisoli]|uniref:DNA-3-methyladenine glycosylase I n=2 Tax=Aerococcus agrisoli TaxID=2487350 RepID=A0A3N4G8C0_9LACT|nr:DNA-3-methyladenine glycosylase I [Aerococcus agrisoli]
MVTRCRFANTPQMIAYHDEEWGRIKDTSQEIFESLSLEAMQAGLSWAIILNKRPALRRAFADFDMETLAQFDEDDVERLMKDERIIRHRLKIKAMISNAQTALAIENDPNQTNFRDYIYQMAEDFSETFNGQEAEINQAMAKRLKKEGFKFVGPTIVEAYLEAIGVYNHHEKDCFLR